MFAMKYEKLWASKTSLSSTAWDHPKPVELCSHIGDNTVIPQLFALVYVFSSNSYGHSIHLSMVVINTWYYLTSSLFPSSILQLKDSPQLATVYFELFLCGNSFLCPGMSHHCPYNARHWPTSVFLDLLFFPLSKMVFPSSAILIQPIF